MKQPNSLTTLQDETERQKALDPQSSFIVQAPAGSGKTELLTQRYLVLLSQVNYPEEILSVTFTKKSAGEMRARILNALAKTIEPEPDSDHEKKTWLLARKALQKNNEKGWDLLDNPNRLQIQTIDSFNSRLTRQLPLLSQFGGPIEITEDPSSLYHQAVKDFLSHLESNVDWTQSIEVLLTHLDNDLEKVEKLLVSMLSKRDQWMPYITRNLGLEDLRSILEKNLEHVIEDYLTVVCRLFPSELAGELLELLHFSALNLKQENSSSPIIHCIDLNDLPKAVAKESIYWRGIASLLLTEEGTWRKSITKKQGFPAPSDTKNSSLKSHLNYFKLRMKSFLEAICENESLRLALREILLLPEPVYLDHHWDTLEALHQILYVVVAHLKLIFQERGQIDYIENAQAALLALGTDEEPTDLTLALDYKIQHILIDEFQDTSNSQMRLLEKLLMGWEVNDGRTLFVVGDPMQSIYRFREADVGLFIKARQQGITAVPLKPLTLSVNFRSQAGIVNWVNEYFQKIFPSVEDISSGSVVYTPSTTSNDNVSEAVNLYPLVDSDNQTQADAIVQLILQKQRDKPDEKIAILVRSRSHLVSILPALKQAKIPFRALDIEPLANRPIIQDLLALTRALMHPADRIAWLSVLRAPWCGLSLSDLLLIAGDSNNTILSNCLRDPNILSQLSEFAREKLTIFIPIIENAINQRRRGTFRDWIEKTWIYLGGPACANHKNDLDDAEAFFQLLEKLEKSGDAVNLNLLFESIDKLYAKPDTSASDALQIMTIHNAKGLEFDIVILPHIERRASQDDKTLLQWLERTRENEVNDLIIAPIEATGERSHPIYDFIKRQHAARTAQENSRLLYVAATRAKKELHLFFNLKSKEDEQTDFLEPAHNSLLRKLWDALPKPVLQKHLIHTKLDASKLSNNQKPQLKRLIAKWVNPISLPIFDSSGYHQQESGFKLPDHKFQQIGIVIHRILQTLSLLGIEWWENHSDRHEQFILKNLLNQGMLKNDTAFALPIIKKAIENTLSDPRGKWILHPHLHAQSEYSLMTVKEHLIIDRTFVDEKGIRWIIDYKSTEYAGTNLEIFLHEEQKKHENQLFNYYLAMKELHSEPIRVGLYFPLIPAWKEWSCEEINSRMLVAPC